ncbi:MAG: prolipoprotein diacylglyceryl transferase family protein, partial [Pseudomonadota bacterium]|nr:prolipoprotein diacylglyceryl transferase family protein [Pseudomonadota bacterium]
MGNWFDPVAFYVWHFPVRWYALSWAVSFLFMLYVPSHLVKRSPKILSYWHDIVTNALIISIIGGRIGEMLIF